MIKGSGMSLNSDRWSLDFSSYKRGFVDGVKLQSSLGICRMGSRTHCKYLLKSSALKVCGSTYPGIQ